MHAAPALRLTVRRFALWRVLVGSLVAASAAAAAAWLAAHLQFEGSALGWLPGAAAVLGGLAAAVVSRRAPVELSWDGSRWQMAAAARDKPAGDPRGGDLQVMVDLGGFLLLRLRPEGGAGSGPWLPVQRRGLEPHWHALRCAVYSPRPAAASAPADAPPPA